MYLRQNRQSHLHAWWTLSPPTTHLRPTTHQYPKILRHYPSHVNGQKMSRRLSSVFSFLWPTVKAPHSATTKIPISSEDVAALGFVDLFPDHHVITSSWCSRRRVHWCFIQLIHSTMRSPPNKEEEAYQMDISYQDLLVEERRANKVSFKSFLVLRPVSWFILLVPTISIRL